MKPTVYVETSVVGYLTSEFTKDVVTAAHQKLTRDWWQTASDRYSLVSSILVLEEASRGDSRFATPRAEIVQSLTMLVATEEAIELSERLLEFGAVPKVGKEDAVHLGIAISSGVDFLVTWNCKHIANADARPRIHQVCMQNGYSAPIICTPQELRGLDDYV